MIPSRDKGFKICVKGVHYLVVNDDGSRDLTRLKANGTLFKKDEARDVIAKGCEYLTSGNNARVVRAGRAHILTISEARVFYTGDHTNEDSLWSDVLGDARVYETVFDAKGGRMSLAKDISDATEEPYSACVGAISKESVSV